MIFDEMDYMRLPTVLAKTIQHAEEYIKKTDAKESTRRIFKRVPYDQEERKQLQQFKELLESNKIIINPDAQTDDVLLRFLYACQFKQNDTKEMFTNHLMWLMDKHSFELDKSIVEIFQQGVMYLSGRDKQYRPTLIINSDLFNTTHINPMLLNRALSILCIIMEDYCFYDGKVENWNVIIDLKEKCIINVKVDEYQKIVNQMTDNFPNTVEKIYIINPSLSIQLAWNTLIEHVPNKKKIVILQDCTLLKRVFELTQLEKKYGGKMENIKKYWPPTNTLPDSRQHKDSIKIESQQQFEQEIQQKQSETIKKSLLQSKRENIQIRDYSIYPQQEEHDFKLFTKKMIPEPTNEPINNISKYNRFTTYVPQTQAIPQYNQPDRKTDILSQRSHQSVSKQSEQHLSEKHSIRQQTNKQQQQSQQLLTPVQQQQNTQILNNNKVQEQDDNYSACIIY